MCVRGGGGAGGAGAKNVKYKQELTQNSSNKTQNKVFVTIYIFKQKDNE